MHSLMISWQARGMWGCRRQDTEPDAQRSRCRRQYSLRSARQSRWARGRGFADGDEGFRERWGRLGHEDLCRGHRGAFRKPGRCDVEIRDEGTGGAVWGGRDLLLRQGTRELVERVERVPFSVKQVVKMQYVVNTVDSIPLTAMCRGPLPAGWSIWPWTLNTPGAPSSTSLHTLSAPFVRVNRGPA